jgi:hypothetical protein
MPVQLEALKLAEASGSRSEMRKWIGALLVAGIIGTLCGFWAILHLTYIHGNPIFGQEAWDRYSNWMTTPNPPNANVSLAIVVGFVFAGLMQVMRTTGLWWPFHPLAYAVSGSWEMNLLWSSLLVAWMVKGITLRFGGAQGYLKSLPFFYGLILGQFVPGMLLNIWGLIANAPTYQFWQ